MTDKPNILWIVVDCLRADKVFGEDRRCRTPCLDQLRNRGTSFTQCISTATVTTPSMATMLTGQFPTFHGVRSHTGHKLNPATVTLAQHLKQAGYRTLARVTGPLGVEVGLDRGFDDYQWRRRREYVHGPWGEALVNEVRSLRAQTSTWFLFLHLFELHSPRQVLPPYDTDEFGRNTYERALSTLDPVLARIVEAAGPDTVVVLTGDHGERIFSTRARERWHEWTYPVRRPFRKMYLNLSPVPVSGAFFEAGHGFHIYDELVRVPLVCGGPMFPAGMIIAQQVRHVDLAPTILELAGHHPESLTINGKSLLPLLHGRTDERPAYCEALRATVPNPKSLVVGLRTPKHKYSYHPFTARAYEELYDLEADPGERRNLARSQPQLCAELRKQLQALSQEFESEPILRGEKMTEAEQQVLEERLKDLGYIE